MTTAKKIPIWKPHLDRISTCPLFLFRDGCLTTAPDAMVEIGTSHSGHLRVVGSIETLLEAGILKPDMLPLGRKRTSHGSTPEEFWSVDRGGHVATVHFTKRDEAIRLLTKGPT